MSWGLTAYYLLIGAIVAFVVGYYTGKRSEAKYWRRHAEFRSVIYSDDAFYYVVPENEYLELTLGKLKTKYHLEPYGIDYGTEEGTSQWLKSAP